MTDSHNNHTQNRTSSYTVQRMSNGMDLSQFRSYILKNAEGMTELDLTGQVLRVLPKEVFHCPKIQVLKVSRNKLRDIPKTISGLRQLRVLHAGNNFISSLPETIVNCTNLTELDIENNCISTLPVNLGLMSQLKILKLGQNELESLTNEIGFLENLRFLDLHGNKLWYLPFSMENLSKLRQLNLSSNKFEHLPMPVCRIKSLELLNLSRNQLISLAPDFDNLNNLKELNLSMNRLKVVPPGVCQAKELRYLNLASNELKELPSQLSKLSKLQVLHAQQNCLEFLPENFNNLRYLNISQNNLRNFSVGGMKKLTYLNASKNLLENTPMAMFNLSKLEHLKLNANQITFLSQDIILLKNLKTLDLGNNRLTNLPQVINELKHLDFFNIKGNSINQRLHPAIGEEGQRGLGGEAVFNEMHRITGKPPLGYRTVTGAKSLNKPRLETRGAAEPKTLSHRTGMWTQEELLQDGFSPELVNDSQSCVIIGNNSNAETTEVTVPEHYYNHEGITQDDNHMTHLNQFLNSDMNNDDKGGGSTWIRTKGGYSLRQHFKGPLSKYHRGSWMNQTDLYPYDGEKRKQFSDDHNNTETNLTRVAAHSSESLSSTDFKLLGVCSQLEAMLNEELLHPQHTQPDSIPRSFTNQHIWNQKEHPIMKDTVGTLSHPEPRQTGDTLYLQPPTPCRRRLVPGGSKGSTLLPPPQKFTDGYDTDEDFSPPPRRKSTHRDFWEPEIFHIQQLDTKEEFSPPVRRKSPSEEWESKRYHTSTKQQYKIKRERSPPTRKKSIHLENWELDKPPNTPKRHQYIINEVQSPPIQRESIHSMALDPKRSQPSIKQQQHNELSPPIRRKLISSSDFWEPRTSPVSKQKPLHVQQPVTKGYSFSPPPFQGGVHSGPYPGTMSVGSDRNMTTSANIDRFMLSHQGRMCVSSVDPKVVIQVPKNGASRPAYVMIQLETIPDSTLIDSKKTHDLVANIVSLGPILHITTSEEIDCHGTVTTTIPMPPGGKKGKLHLLTVRADNSCIPCTAGYHVKNGYLTLQSCHLSGKVAVFTRSKCKYKACKSVEQLLQFHYI